MAETFSFDNFEIDTNTFELRKDGTPVPVEPLVLDLILVMLRSPGKLLTRDDLIDAVWDGRIVSESTISTAVKSARKVLGDTGNEQRYIRTIRGRGFQFIGQVAVNGGAPQKPAPIVSASVRPALYVRVVALDEAVPAAQVRALESRLRTILNRVPLLRIAARINDESVFEDPRELLTRFGVTHCADIMLSELGDVLCADASLTQTKDGMQSWARMIKVKQGAGWQEALLHQVLSYLEPAIVKDMIATFTADGDADDPNALVLQAVGNLAIRGWNKQSFQVSDALLQRAIEKKPDFALALAYRSLIKAVGFRVGILRDDPEVVAVAISAADAALEIENQDSLVLGITGCALCDAGQPGRGIPLLERSMELDPSNGHARTARGAAHVLQREFEEAVPLLREGIRISPADSRLAVWGSTLAMAELCCGRVDLALTEAEKAVSRDDRNYLPRLALSAALASSGNGQGFDSSIKDLVRVHPELSENEVLCFVGRELGKVIWDAVENTRMTA